MKIFVGFPLFLLGSEALSGMQLQRIGQGNFPGLHSSMDLALRMSADNEDEGGRRRKRDALVDLWKRVKPKGRDNEDTNQRKEDVTGKDKIMSEAQSLQLQAERMRLEAARMDAELTLAKIAKLEEGLSQAKAKGKPVEDMQLQLKNLQVKLQGINASGDETAAPVVDVQENETSQESLLEAPVSTNEMPPENDVDEAISVDFMEKVISDAIESDSNLSINSSEIALKLSSIKSRDINRDTPYSQEDISEKVKKIEKEIENDNYQKQILDLVDGNLTQLALFSLELEEYVQSGAYNDLNLASDASDESKLKDLFSLDTTEQTALDRSIETLYPKCMRREELTEPTMIQVQSLISNVLPNAKFTRTSNPEKVLGGYVVKGQHTWDTGEDLINAIDAELAKTNLADKMTVLYTPDFTVFSNLDENGGEFDFGEAPSPILYVTTPDYCVGRRRIPLAITSAVGLATSWYLSIYPFLLNPLIASRVEEQLALADSSMSYDLDWLTELSTPFFLSFIGIQVAHEVAHSLVAANYGMNITFPTFVPSLITGITSSVTNFKTPPKTKEAMFDFAVAGPLAGMIFSIIAIGIGSQLTTTSDPSTLPSLPIEILRQSTLGGAIIESFLSGTLYVPDGAQTAGLLVSLHPLAMAGFISLVVNALSLLPIGTTDGGRIAMTMFGRPAKLVVGNLFLGSLLFTGLLGSDLFLFYFAFVIAIQTGNDIACRDETSQINSLRVAVAVAAYSLAFLSLVPIQ